MNDLLEQSVLDRKPEFADTVARTLGAKPVLNQPPKNPDGTENSDVIQRCTDMGFISLHRVRNKGQAKPKPPLLLEARSGQPRPRGSFTLSAFRRRLEWRRTRSPRSASPLSSDGRILRSSLRRSEKAGSLSPSRNEAPSSAISSESSKIVRFVSCRGVHEFDCPPFH